jgi:hypothetical protein
MNDEGSRSVPRLTIKIILTYIRYINYLHRLIDIDWEQSSVRAVLSGREAAGSSRSFVEAAKEA